MVRLIGLVAVACAVAGLAGLAVAQGDDNQAAPEAESDSGLYLNGYAMTGEPPPSRYITGAETSAIARPASDCPDVAAAYDDAGVEIAGILGPCPDPSRATDVARLP
jgi:hypothetical protein